MNSERPKRAFQAVGECRRDNEGHASRVLQVGKARGSRKGRGWSLKGYKSCVKERDP